ncbi:MAG: bifunctional nuclease family protein [Planctomycetes bacterium]|nr:bifunctional nuclease family protein [Planctomycetota bacterium]MCB9904673.1 bifunctional nuclease family protein [Planctomycetota bacterium]
MIEVFLSSIVTRNNSQQQLIKLKEKGGPRAFPIVIGLPEAAEIRRVVKQQATERPMTHELLVAAIEALDAELVRVDITDLRNHTFFARLVLSRGEGTEPVFVDARPSDAIALALRASASLFVAESVLAEVRTDEGVDPLEDEEDEDEADEDPPSI